MAETEVMCHNPRSSRYISHICDHGMVGRVVLPVSCIITSGADVRCCGRPCNNFSSFVYHLVASIVEHTCCHHTSRIFYSMANQKSSLSDDPLTANIQVSCVSSVVICSWNYCIKTKCVQFRMVYRILRVPFRSIWQLSIRLRASSW